MAQKTKSDFLKRPMNVLVILSSISIFLILLDYLTNFKWLLPTIIFIISIVLILYVYISVHIIYKYYWYFNGGKITEERDLDLGFVARSSLVSFVTIIFGVFGVISLVSISQTGDILVSYFPEDYASMIFAFLPALVIGLCLYCITFIILFSYVQYADNKNVHVLKMEVNTNRIIITAIIIHYILSILFYVNEVVPVLKNSSISVTTNNIFILSLAAGEFQIIYKLILTSLENRQILEVEAPDQI